MIGVIMHYQQFIVSIILLMNAVAPELLSLDIISLTSKYAVLHYLPLARVAKLKLVARYTMMNIVMRAHGLHMFCLPRFPKSVCF